MNEREGGEKKNETRMRMKTEQRHLLTIIYIILMTISG